jgi:hypothetical protein
MEGQTMDLLTAHGIKQDFIFAMQIADTCGKTREEAYTEVAKKYSQPEMAEAMIVLNKALEEEKEVNAALFSLAIRSKNKA